MDSRQRNYKSPQALLGGFCVLLGRLFGAIVLFVRHPRPDLAPKNWTNIFLHEERGIELIVANSAISMFELGGFLGTIVAGWGSDILFRGNRVPMNIIFMVGITACILVLWLVPMHDTLPLATAYFFLGFFIFGPQMLTGMAAAEVCHKDYAGTATGFVGLFGYMGAALTGLPLSAIIRGYGWEAFYIVMVVASIFSAIIILPLIMTKKESAKA